MAAKPEWPQAFQPVRDAIAGVRRMADEVHNPSLEGSACYCVWDDGAVTSRTKCPSGRLAVGTVRKPVLLGRYGPFPVCGGAGTFVCVPSEAAAESLRQAMCERVAVFSEGATTLEAMIAAAHNPQLATIESGLVHQVWQDGEITAQKCGSLLGRRNLHMLAPPLQKVRHPMPEGDRYANSYAYVTYSDALRIRAAMALVLGAPDPYRSADELSGRAEKTTPESRVEWIAQRNAQLV